MTCIAVGLTRLSTAMSRGVICQFLLKLAAVGTVTSPDRRNPKKHRRHAAHIIWLLNKGVPDSHTSFKRLKINGVIGRRWSFDCGRDLRAPFSASSSLSRPARGSPKPWTMCKCLTADKYDRIVAGTTLCNSCATNKINSSSDAGNGFSPMFLQNRMYVAWAES